jgi:hypothetical protein
LLTRDVQAYVDEGWFRNESKGWPAQFVAEVAEMMLGVVEGREKRMSFGEIKEEWMRRMDKEKEKEKAVVSSRRSKVALPLVDLAKVKSKRRPVVETPRVHVFERRTMRTKERSAESLRSMHAQAARVLRGGRS